MTVDLTLKSITFSISSLATYTGLTLTTLAQSPPPPGITLPPETPETIEQILPQPAVSPLPSQSPTPLPQPELQTPLPQPPPDITSPESDSEALPQSADRLFIKTIEVLGNTVLHSEIALGKP